MSRHYTTGPGVSCIFWVRETPRYTGRANCPDRPGVSKWPAICGAPPRSSCEACEACRRARDRRISLFYSSRLLTNGRTDAHIYYMGIRDYRYVRNVMIVGCPKCGMPIRVETSINTPDAQTVYSEPTMQYCKVPCSVIRDIGLSPYARLVYAELALNAWNGNVACIGQRLIAERLGISQKVVSKSIQELCKRKHVERRDNGKGHRAHTKLLSPIYLWKKGKGREREGGADD